MSKIIGQDKLIKEVNRIFQVFVNSNCKIRPHFILTGESGSGKSFTIKQLCDMNELNFLEVNAAQITKEGISGNSLSKILSPLVNYSHTPIVVFVDEFDKLFINGNTNSQLANESTASVQNEFLKLLESDTTSVFGDYGKYISVPIDNVLFVFAGAFNNEPHITLDRLRDFGVKTEFLGRVGLIYNTKPLTLEDLYSILECSDLLQNYLDLFFNVNREQVISDLKGYLESSFRNNTLGARGKYYCCYAPFNDDAEYVEVSEGQYYGAYYMLGKIFGWNTTSKDYRYPSTKVGLLYGDSITLERQKQIYLRLENAHMAACNLVLGVGSYSYQYASRDSLGFAIKATACVVNGELKEIFKHPKTDDGTKNSLKGLIAVYKGLDGKYTATDQVSIEEEKEGCLETVFEDGILKKEYSLEEIRQRIDHGL